ncbi:MAG: YVTN family beta-propeller protein [Phenylobacterium sp.]|jgi:YVTN family beta-propeller protein
MLPILKTPSHKAVLSGALFSMMLIPQAGIAASNQATTSNTIAISADNTLVWSVNTDADSVSVVRTDRNSLVATIDVGDVPKSIALSPNNKYAYVTNAADNTVTVIKIQNSKPGKFKAKVDNTAGYKGAITTGSEPSNVVFSPDGKRVFVANGGQDTITVINAKNRKIIGSVDLQNSLCNVGDTRRHFQPRGLAVTKDNKHLYVGRFISFTHETGVQKDDFGKKGVVCRLDINTSSKNISSYTPAKAIQLAPTDSGFKDTKGLTVTAFPNQLQSIVIRDGHIYLPNISASPTGPQGVDGNTQAYVNRIDGVGSNETDAGSINLHSGGIDPEPGKEELYFANPWGVVFTTNSGSGSAYVLSAGSDMLVKLKVNGSGVLSFTGDSDTTRYIDLNDPDDAATSGANAGKNPLGVVINSAGTKAYTNNFISRNLSVVDLTTDKVIKVVKTHDLPTPGSQDEINLVGAEMFYSSRGNFIKPAGAKGSSRNRLSKKARQNCASCHAEGITDGVIWQFASGPRKTLTITGVWNPKDITDMKIVNASAVFDEIEDADFNTRLVSGPGFLNPLGPCDGELPSNGVKTSRNHPDVGLILGKEGDFEKGPCVMNQFAKPNGHDRPQPLLQLPGSHVRVRVHNALIDYQTRAIRTPNRAMTATELQLAGAPTTGGVSAADIAAGEVLFVSAGCSTCHNGGKWTKSHKDFISPPDPSEVASERDSDGKPIPGVNFLEFLPRFHNDIGSYHLNVAGKGNLISGFPAIGGEEIDTNGSKSLGFDHNGDGKGTGFNTGVILGAYSGGPYYHNGACEILECVVADKNHRRAGQTAGQADPLDSADARAKLAAYLKSIDERTPVH